jgi:hypothetical protein
MITTTLFRCLLGCLLACALSAQTTVTDTFASVSGHWEADVVSGGASFVVSGGVLNFTTPALTTGQTASVSRDWSAELPANADWTARVDLTTSAPLVVSQIMNWSFFAASLTNPTPDDYLKAEIVHSYMQTPNRMVFATPYTDGTAGTMNSASLLNAATIGLQFSYNAATRILTLGYDADGATGGHSFTALGTVNTATVWSMSTSDLFGLRLSATNLTNGDTTAGLGNGLFTADDFSVTTAAVPEPSTWALLAGGAALLAAILRRRFGRG